MQDTIRAGDTLTAALLFSLDQASIHDRAKLTALHKTELQRHLEFAVCAAGLNCMRPTCQPPDLAEIQAAIQF